MSARAAWLLIGALLLAVLLGCITAYALGLKGIADIVLARIAPVHRIGAIHRLDDGRIEVQNLYLQASHWRLHIDLLRAQIVLPELARGRLRLPNAQIGSLRLEVRTDSQTQATPIDLPTFAVDKLQLARASLLVDRTRVLLTDLRGRVEGRGRSVVLSGVHAGLQTAGQGFRLANARLAATLEVPRQLQLRAAWQRVAAPDSNGSDRGALQLAGTPSDLRGLLRLDTPVPARVALVIARGVVGAATARVQLGSAQLTGLVGSIDLRRRPFIVRVRTETTLPALGVLQVRAAAAWTGAQFPLRARIVAGPNRALLSGQIDPASWRGSFTLSGDNIDADHWLAGARSQLQLRGEIQAQLLAPFAAELQLRANGALLARAFAAETSFAVGAAGVTLHAARLHNAQNDLLVRAQNGALLAELDLRDLHSLSLAWRGSITGDARLQGRKLQLALRGARLAFAERLRAGRAQLSGSADLDGKVNLRLVADDAAIAGRAIEHAEASVEGDARAHRAQLEVRTQVGALSAAVQGGWSADLRTAGWRDGSWSGELHSASLRTPDYGRWRLRAPVRFTASANQARMTGASGLCLDGEESAQASSRLCVTRASYDATGVRAVGTVAAFPLAVLPLAAAERLQPQGLLDANFALQPGAARGNAALRDASVVLAGKRIALEHVDARFDWPLTANGSATLDAKLRSSLLGDLRAQLQRRADGTLAGSVDAQLRDLGYLQALLLNSRRFYLEGTAALRLTLSGSTASPHLGGSGEVHGKLRLPALGIAALPLELTIDGRDRALAWRGTIGGLRGTGNIGLDSLTEPRIEARISGEALRLVEREDLVASISPDLHIVVADNFANVTGKVRVDSADIRFASADARRGGLSDDVIIHPALDPRAPPPTTASAAPAFNWAADLQLELGDAVNFSAAGLKTRLIGRLRVLARPPSPLRVLGYVDAVDGSFDTYGVRLKLQRGRLDFNGPADNPRVSARAVRLLDDSGTNLVGVTISGPLQLMDTQLLSQPARSAEDTLALLVTGQSLANSSASDLQSVGQAGLALGVLDALPVTSVVRDSLGLDELDVRNPLDRANSQIRIGKQLTDRLRVRYVYSVFNRTGGLQLRWQVLRGLSLQTETGADTNAIDLLWEWQSEVPTAPARALSP